MNRLPPEIDVRELLPHGVHYILPPRDLGKFRWVAKGMVWLGLIAAAGCLGWATLVVWKHLARPNPDWFRLLDLLFCLPFAVGGLTVAAFGCFLLSGRAEIEFSSGVLMAIERAGWLRWTWKRPLAAIDKLEIVPALSTQQDEPAPDNVHGDYFRIKAGDIFLAPGYPKAWCAALAADLRRRWRAAVGGDASAKIPEVVEESFSQTKSVVTRERVEQPAGSCVQCVDTPENLTLRVPPAGLRKGTKGLFGFAVIWNAFMAIMTVLMLGLGGIDDIPPLIIVLAIGAFWAVGIGTLLGAINMARREAAIVVAGDQLMVAQKGIFGTKRRAWSRDDIDTVVCASSGMKINEVPVLELQVRPAKGGKFGVLAGRDNDELQWMATLLRNRLDLAPTPGEQEPAPLGS